MTAQKKLKQRIRARMAETGESFTTARRHILAADRVRALPDLSAMTKDPPVPPKRPS